MNGARCVLKSKTGSLRISKAADLVACPDATFMFGKGRGFLDSRASWETEVSAFKLARSGCDLYLLNFRAAAGQILFFSCLTLSIGFIQLAPVAAFDRPNL
jgi:hypothetical protein